VAGREARTGRGAALRSFEAVPGAFAAPQPAHAFTTRHQRAPQPGAEARTQVNWLAVMVGSRRWTAAMVLTLPSVEPRIAC